MSAGRTVVLETSDYQFVMGYTNYILSEHDYGQGIPLTMIEVHTLTYIEDHPDVAITELSQIWHKTKSALSQVITHLEREGLLTKSRKEGNAREMRLELTELGRRMSRAHKRHDTEDIVRTTAELRRECTEAEVDAFYKVLSVYNSVMEDDFQARPPRRGRRARQVPAPSLPPPAGF